MSRKTTPAGPPMLAFADVNAGVWGLAVGDPSDGLTVAPLDDNGPAVSGVHDSLKITPADGPAAATPALDGELELIRVSGSLALPDGAELAIDGGGIRCSAAPPSGGPDSVRLITAWFSSEHAVGLMATRPAGASNQQRDQVTAVCAGEREGVIVFDPRLSTTYDPSGNVRRMGIELWLGETEEGDQYPRRLAGEASGSATRRTTDGLVLQASPLRCHSRKELGGGVYVLIRAA